MDGSTPLHRLRRILAIAERDEDAPNLLEKSLSLAHRCGARVEALVTDAAQMRSVMKLCRQYTDDEILVSCMHRGAGPIAELVLNRLDTSAPDLIVKSTDVSDSMLLAESPVPVLIVRQRPWSQPVRIAVIVEAADSVQMETSREALAAATLLAVGCCGYLDILYSEPVLDDEALKMERAVTVAKLVREVTSGYGRLQMFSGAPRDRLPPLIAAGEYDILVPVAGILFARDILLVRSASHTETRMAARRQGSRRQQSPHQVQQFFGIDRLADDAQIHVGLEFADHG